MADCIRTHPYAGGANWAQVWSSVTDPQLGLANTYCEGSILGVPDQGMLYRFCVVGLYHTCTTDSWLAQPTWDLPTGACTINRPLITMHD